MPETAYCIMVTSLYVRLISLFRFLRSLLTCLTKLRRRYCPVPNIIANRIKKSTSPNLDTSFPPMTSKKEEIIMSTSMAVIKIEAKIRIRRFLFFGKKGEV